MFKKLLIAVAILAIGIGALIVLKDGSSKPEYVTEIIEKGSSPGGRNQDDIVIVPLLTAQRKFLGITYISSMFVKAKEGRLAEAEDVIFGYYPALKASRLDPIEALRYE